MSDFRPATPGDVAPFLVLQRAFYADDGYPFREAEARANLLRLLADPNLGRVWVTEDAGTVVGYVVLTFGFSLEFRGRDAFLDELYLAPGHRGRGLGQKALALVEAACREMGVRALHLEVEKHKTAAQALYRKIGFDDHDRYLMTKWIDTTRVLMVPGLWNSGPQHWQSLWEAREPGFRRVEQKEWETPDLEDWLANLEAAVAEAGPGVVLAAHSLGCATVVHWAARTKRTVRAAFLVAPSDVDGPTYPEGPTGFGPMPLHRLPFPSLVAASSDDPWATLERSRLFADAWGSRFVNVGPAGHLNTASGHGPWPEGRRLLAELLGETAD